jgi:hypothetical protein
MPIQTTRYAKMQSNLTVLYGMRLPLICNNSPQTYASPAEAIEDPAWPIANLLDRDRGLVWKVPPREIGDNSVSVQFDLGAEQSLAGAGFTINAIGLLGFSLLDPASPLETYVEFYYKTSNTGWGGGWTQIGTSGVLCERDLIISISPEIQDVKFIQATFISLAGTPGWTLGKLFVAEMGNLGIAYGLGSSEFSVMSRSRVLSMDGRQYVTEYGLERRGFKMEFPTVLNDTKVALVSLAKELQPFVLHAPSGEAFECRSTSDSIEASVVFGVVGSASNDVWNVSLAVESLP